MYLPQKNRFLHRDILDLLEKETDFITMKEMVERLKYPSLHAVKNACHELQEVVGEVYAPENLELIISVRGGIRLKRLNTNLQKLTQVLNNQSLSFQLALQVFDKRIYPVAKFCEENFISRSTLFRHLKKTNDFFARYSASEIKITLSDSLKMTGAESSIRIIYYLLLKSNFDSLEDQTDWNEMIQLTKKILSFLDIPSTETQTQHLALWVYVCQKAINKCLHITENDSNFMNKSFFTFAEKPNFLDDWHQSDWEFFLLFLWALEYMPVNQAVIVENDTLYKTQLAVWFEAFEKEFFPVTRTKKEELVPTLRRQLQYVEMTKFKDGFEEVLEFPKPEMIQENYPTYYQHFLKFWESFTQKLSSEKPLAALRSPSFGNCLSLVELTYFMPSVSIYVITELTSLVNHFIQEKVKTYCSRFKISFVDDYQQADVIVSSVTFLDSIKPNQKLIMIRASLSENDLATIYQTVHKVINKKVTE